MGRAKVTLKRIQNARARKSASAQRKKGLIKKISDFSIMCEAKACLIVYDADADGNGEPVTWSEDPTVMHSILEKYERKKRNNDKPPKIFDLEDFFDNRKRMVEAEITKIQKEIVNIKYPSLDSMTAEQKLLLVAKIEACQVRINMLKNNKSFSQDDQLVVLAPPPPPMKPLVGLWNSLVNIKWMVCL